MFKQVRPHRDGNTTTPGFSLTSSSATSSSIPINFLHLSNMHSFGIMTFTLDLLVILLCIGAGIPTVTGEYVIPGQQPVGEYLIPSNTSSAYVNLDSDMENRVVSVGEDAEFACIPNIQQHKRFEIRWKHNDYILNLTNTEKYKTNDLMTNITIKSATFDDAGVYTCMVVLDMDIKMSKANLTVKGVPDPPLDVKIVSCPNGRAELSWRPGNDNGYRITNFFIQYNSSHNPTLWHTYEEPILPSWTNYYMNLRPWGTYSIRMLSENKLGLSKPSSPTKRTCSAPPSHPDRNPKEVWTRTDQTGKLIIQWTSMQRFYHHGPNFKYRVSWQRRGSTFWNDQEVKDSGTGELQVDVDDVYTPYNIKVKALNAMGDSRQPPFVFEGYSGEGRPLNRPKDFRLDPHFTLQPHEAHFIWEAVDTSEDQIRGEFKGYKLQYWKASEGRNEMKEIDIYIGPSERNGVGGGHHHHHRSHHHGQEVRASISNLPAYTAMRAQVCVMNTHFVGHPSNVVDFFTPEGKPGPVKELRIESYGATFVLLKWSQPTDPNGKLLGYDIGYQSVDSHKSVGPIELLKPQINSPTTLGARITGLKRDHYFRFYVWARTGAGKGPHSVVDVKTVHAYPPTRPSPHIVSVSSTIMNISWIAPDSKYIGYSLEYRRLGDREWIRTKYEWTRKWMLLGYLDPGTRYQVRVVALNNFGDKASSRTLLVQTADEDNGTYYQASNGIPGPHQNSAPATVIGNQSNLSLSLAWYLSLLILVPQVFH